MPKNLKEKISLLLEDIEALNKYEATRVVETFINTELEFLEAEHNLDNYDLCNIKSMAVQEITNLNLNNYRTLDEDYVSTFCYVDSVIQFLRSKGLIGFTLVYDKERKGGKTW